MIDAKAGFLVLLVPIVVLVPIVSAANAFSAEQKATLVSVTRHEGSCDWLRRSNCWSRMLRDFDDCAPPPVRADLHVDGVCRYYDGTMVRSRERYRPEDGPRMEASWYELTVEIHRDGRHCFSIKRTVRQAPRPSPRHVPVTKEIVTELTSRSGTLRYVEAHGRAEQDREYAGYLRARHARGSEVVSDERVACDPSKHICIRSTRRDDRPRGLASRAFGEGWVGFLTCPNQEMVMIGFAEYTSCPSEVPFRPFWAHIEGNAIDFAFSQPHLSSGLIACGPFTGRADHLPTDMVGQNTRRPPLPPAAFPEEGSIPARLFPPGRHAP